MVFEDMHICDLKLYSEFKRNYNNNYDNDYYYYYQLKNSHKTFCTLHINKQLSSASATKEAHLNSDKIHSKHTAELDGSSTLHTEQGVPSPLIGKICALFGQYETIKRGGGV